MNLLPSRMLLNLACVVFSLLVALPAVGSVASDSMRGVDTYRPYFEVSQGLVSADFRATPLKQALKMVAAQSAVDLYLDKSVTGTVTARFKNLPLGKALKRMLRQQSFVLTYDKASKPAELWLIKEGQFGFDVIRGYRGDMRRDSGSENSAAVRETSIQQTMRENNLPAALGMVQLHGAMGASHWRKQMGRNHSAVAQSAWRNTAIQKTIQMKREVLHRALATAPPSQRPEIAQQMVALTQQERSVVVGAKNQQFQAVKDAQKLASLRTTVQLPTQKIAQQKALQQRQLVMVRQRQRQMRMRAAQNNRRFSGGLLSKKTPQQTRHRWIVR